MMNARNQSFSSGLLAGAAIGAAVALLYAPKRGKKTRRHIREFGRKTANEITETGVRLRTKGQDLAERGREAADRVVERGRDLADGAAGDLRAIGEKTGIAGMRNSR